MAAEKKALQPRIIFEDTYVIVLSKPAGLLSQGAEAGEPNLVDWLRKYLGRPYVGLVHRLDRNTSGIMVVAKRSKGANRLTEALQKGLLRRKYLAWLEGVVTESATWKHHLSKDEASNRMRVYREETAGSKVAVLSLRPIRQARPKGTDLTLVEIELETGRSHQIRAQSAFEGHPVAGDVKYGSKFAYPRTALHSFWIRFPHPIGGKPLEFDDSLPDDLRF